MCCDSWGRKESDTHSSFSRLLWLFEFFLYFHRNCEIICSSSVCVLCPVIGAHHGHHLSTLDEAFEELSTSTGSLASQRHPGKFPKVPGKNKVSIGAWVYSWVFYLVPLVCISVFVPVPYCLDDCGFVVQPEVRESHGQGSLTGYSP